MAGLRKKAAPWLAEGAFYFGLFVFSVKCYIYFAPLLNGTRTAGIPAKCFALVLLAATGIAAGLSGYLGRLDRRRIILLMILAGFALHLGYIMYVPADFGQYDTWGSSAGHFAYADTLFSTGALPKSNSYQFYHPPLNAFIQSAAMHIFSGIFGVANDMGAGLDAGREGLFAACRTLSLLYSTVTAVFACKIFKALNIGGRGGLIASAFVIFFPRFTQLSGQLNNDALCLMLSVIALYRAVLFCQNQSCKNIAVLAVFTGLAVMAKLNGALICIPIGMLMLFVFAERAVSRDRTQICDIVKKYALFLGICAPLALWFQVYAYIRFGQPFGYIFAGLNSELSTADVPIINRFFLPKTGDVLSSPFANSWEDYNLLDFMTKSSMFGEFSFAYASAVAAAAVAANYAFQLVFAVSFVMYIRQRRLKGQHALNFKSALLVSIFVIFIAAQVFFYIKMPYGCTMDFRYVMPVVLAYGGMAGIMYNASRRAGRVFRITANITMCLALLMTAAASVVYIAGV